MVLPYVAGMFTIGRIAKKITKTIVDRTPSIIPTTISGKSLTKMKEVGAFSKTEQHSIAD